MMSRVTPTLAIVTQMRSESKAADAAPDAPADMGDVAPSAEACTAEPLTGDDGQKQDTEQDIRYPLDDPLSDTNGCTSDGCAAPLFGGADALSPARDASQDDQSVDHWRTCRCNHTSRSGVVGSAQTAPHGGPSSNILWPFVVVVLALAGALAFAVWFDAPAETHFASVNSTVVLSAATATTEADLLFPPTDVFGTAAAAVAETTTAAEDDREWCACLCQPKGPLVTGRIVDDRCACHCLAPVQAQTATAQYHFYAVCVATIVQMGSFLIAAVALGCILTF
nr:hypothetical protein [Pandoravirus massiliensis]